MRHTPSNRRPRAALIALLTTLLTTSAPVRSATVPELDVDRFNAFMKQRFTDRSKGFAWSLVERKRTVTEGAHGWAQDPHDGNLRMAPDTPSNIGSVSKLITGVALLDLLRESPISNGTANAQLDEEIVNYLPRDWRWRYGARLKGLTFRHLLQHKSGLPTEGDTPDGWPKVEYALSRGPVLDGCRRSTRNGKTTLTCPREYNNNNISMMRFLMPQIAYRNETTFIDTLHTGKPRQAYWDAILPQYDALYKEYMNARFFPQIFSGAHPVCNPYDELGPNTFAKAYQIPIPIPDDLPAAIEARLKGYFPRPDACAPQGGFYFSVRQFAKFAKVFSQTDKLVTPGLRQRMMRPDNIDDRLVFNKVLSGDDFAGETGISAWVYHGGSFKGYAAAFIKLPDGHFGMAVANTATVSSDDLASALYYAFVYATKGLPAEHLSSNDKHHFAYRDGVYITAGSSRDHAATQAFYRGSLGGGRRWENVFDISANDRHHFAWFKEGSRLRVMRGSSDDLDKDRQPYTSRLDPNFSITQLQFVSSNDALHFAWYRSGNNLYVSAGPSDDLAGTRRAQSVELAPGKTPQNLVAITSNDRYHFAFYDDCTYSAGQSRKLASEYAGRRYDCEALRR